MENPLGYPIVVFDGSCGFCLKSLKFLRKRFQFKDVNFLPYTEENARIWNFPREVIVNKDRYMFFLTNNKEVHKGYFAFRMLFKTEGRLIVLHHLMLLKPIEIVGRWVYMLISRNRSRISGKNSSCGI